MQPSCLATSRLSTLIQKHGQAVFGEAMNGAGTPPYTDVRLCFVRAVALCVIYGAGPRKIVL
jgi:hypothetical protein